MTRDEITALSILAQRANQAQSNRDGMWRDFVRAACEALGPAKVGTFVKECMEEETKHEHKELGDDHSGSVPGRRG